MLVAVAVLGYACLRWRPSRVEINGASMAPTLVPGDWALTIPVRALRKGWVVVAEHPERPGFEMVKRLTAGPGESVGAASLGEDEWWLEGDHPSSSTDSRSFGAVPADLILARVVLVYWPPGRRRAL